MRITRMLESLAFPDRTCHRVQTTFNLGELHTSQTIEGALKLVNLQDEIKTGNQEEIQIGGGLILTLIMFKGLEGF